MSITTINAYAVKRRGGTAEPFSYERTLGNNAVLVRVTHCSIARGDIQFIDNDWGDTRFPLVPGHEIVGLVDETGSTVAGMTTGDRVGIGYQQAACFSCEFCKDGLEQSARSKRSSASTATVVWPIHRRRQPVCVPTSASAGFGQERPRCCRRASPSIQAIVQGGTARQLGRGGIGDWRTRLPRDPVSSQWGTACPRSLIRLPRRRSSNGWERGRRQCDAWLVRRRQKTVRSDSLDAEHDVRSQAYLGMLKPQGKLCVVAQPLEMLSISAGILYDKRFAAFMETMSAAGAT